MIEGEFDSLGQLFFEIDLITADGEILPTTALLDTGSTEWLAINSQDLDALSWVRSDRRDVLTAMGETILKTYIGKVVFGGEESTIEAVAGSAFRETIIGLPWLWERRLIADFPTRLLTLERS